MVEDQKTLMGYRHWNDDVEDLKQMEMVYCAKG